MVTLRYILLVFIVHHGSGSKIHSGEEEATLCQKKTAGLFMMKAAIIMNIQPRGNGIHQASGFLKNNPRSSNQRLLTSP
eukprot:10294648-Ditylum_brightwellii.AAC.1